jgi:hypothetical protein
VTQIEEPDAINWKRIEGFIGFGRRDAPVVFVGMEEGLKDAGALDEDLLIRSGYATPVMDLKEAHRGIAGTERYFDPDFAPRQPTWRVMADLMLRRAGNLSPNSDDRRRYRALHLGRAHGDTLLTELLPYPHPKASDWLYKRFGKFRTREDYVREMLPSRIELLRGVLAESNRQLVVCYGKAHWEHYQRLFQARTWADEGSFRVADAGITRVVLTPHFSSLAFNTDAQLAQLHAVTLGSKPKSTD